MSALVFVDTNVLLYKCDATDSAKQRRAAEWVSYLWRERTGRTSTQVLSEFYFNATRKLKPGLPTDEAWDEVLAYLTWEPLPIDAEVLKAAKEVERRYRLSWWDSAVVAAAQLQGCELLLTEDLQDGLRMGSLVVRSPFTLDAREAVAEYAGAPRARALHRPRGRPARAVV